ncbi:hypothetical protein [Clostridium sp. UBA5119]|uniref:hypothetical protein n=1 Tax=Clostridium sp. UBA5119 TaxID=1946366 RepID=UPI0032177C36
MEWMNESNTGISARICNKDCGVLCRDKFGCGVKICSGRCGNYDCGIYIGS